jgi:hypothetical protein
MLLLGYFLIDMGIVLFGYLQSVVIGARIDSPESKIE